MEFDLPSAATSGLMLPKTVTKRDGRIQPFQFSKIVEGINNAFFETKPTPKATPTKSVATNSARLAVSILSSKQLIHPTVSQVMDAVEQALLQQNLFDISMLYSQYRLRRDNQTFCRTRLMQRYYQVSKMDATQLEVKRENANINGNTSMALIFKFGSEGSIEYLREIGHDNLKAFLDAHFDGSLHIHNLDFFLTGTTTCCQIDIEELLQRTFSTGHGSIRPPKDILSYCLVTAMVLQSNQNDQHGGQAIPAFDYAMAPGVRLTYLKTAATVLAEFLLFDAALDVDQDALRAALTGKISLGHWDDIDDVIVSFLTQRSSPPLDDFDAHDDASESLAPQDILATLHTKLPNIKQMVQARVEERTFQAMEGLIHNLNTMHSRVGAQVPFTSLNFGTDTSVEGRLVSKMLLKAQWEGLGNGETALFPITIFKVKEGINYNPGDPNFDLFELAIKVSAKRLFPNFVFLDAPFNLQYYKPGDYRTEAVAMGCRTRVIGSVFPESDGIVTGRGNLSFTTINIVRIALETGDIAGFFSTLEEMCNVAANGLLERYKVQCRMTVKNFPFLMREGIWMGSKDLTTKDSLENVLKHGTLAIGFIGLAECLKCLMDKHHGESPDAQALGLRIVRFMREFCDKRSQEHHLNFSLLATPAEGLAGRFVKIDRERYGELLGITDRDYYTNSFHVPVYFPISAADKIKLEAPYHAFCNGGHISYIEMDGDPLKNLPAFEKIIRLMKENNIGYGSINHPVDRDPVCGFSGIINNECPQCHRHETEAGHFERLRRITGYLVGSLERWNNAKQAEERDRVKHMYFD